MRGLLLYDINSILRRNILFFLLCFFALALPASTSEPTIETETEICERIFVTQNKEEKSIIRSFKGRVLSSDTLFSLFFTLPTIVKSPKKLYVIYCMLTFYD